MLSAIITVGAPASGKSTYASRALDANPDMVEINRDNIRMELSKCSYAENLWDSWDFNKQQEGMVTNEFNKQLKQAIQLEKDIICSDTNLNDKRREMLQDCLEQMGYDVEIVPIHVNYDTLVKQNKQRVNKVNEFVLRNMWQKMERFMLNHTNTRSRYIDPDQKILICDIDGTVSTNDGKRGWYEWGAVIHDSPRQHVIDMVQALAFSKDYRIVFVSGRDVCCYNDTKLWLEAHFEEYASHYDIQLLMRPHKTNNCDTEVKLELFDVFLRENHARGNIVAVFDDRPVVVEMWQDLGLNTIAVADQRNRF